MKNLTKEEAKKIVMTAIFERAYEISQKAEELIGIMLPADADRGEIQAASLKKAVQEWDENKPVFDLPAEFKK